MAMSPIQEVIGINIKYFFLRISFIPNKNVSIKTQVFSLQSETCHVIKKNQNKLVEDTCIDAKDKFCFLNFVYVIDCW